VTSEALAATPVDLDRKTVFSVIPDVIRESLAVTEVEMKKILRDPMDIFTRSVQPILWLTVFGQVMSRVRGISSGETSYLDFMTPGILAQSVLFSAIFFGISVIWERDLGIIHKLLVSPAWRLSLVFGKAVAAGFRGLFQAIIVYIVAWLMGVSLNWQPLAILGVLFSVVLGSAIFSTFSLTIACLVKTRERFMGIGQVLTMPLFFASNAIYPIEMMPPWLRGIASSNPLTYLVDALRGLMIVDGHHVHAYASDFGILVLVFIGLMAIVSKLYPTLVR
jgi:ABC-2 type transport system permease protein